MSCLSEDHRNGADAAGRHEIRNRELRIELDGLKQSIEKVRSMRNGDGSFRIAVEIMLRSFWFAPIGGACCPIDPG